MGEYQWRKPRGWIGVMDSERRLLGIIQRAGTVRALGHFCFVEVSFLGRQYQASGAEDRIFPFHSLKLAVGEARDAADKLEAVALGWLSDGNTFAFRDPETGDVFACGERGARLPVDASKLPDCSTVAVHGGERAKDIPAWGLVHVRCLGSFACKNGIRSTITGEVLEAPRQKGDAIFPMPTGCYCAHCGAR